MNGNPIGIFDSGMGGLSVWKNIRAALPEESLLYFADAAHCPYGNRDLEEIRGYVEQYVGEMIGKGVKMIVIACNTATAAAVKGLREKYPDFPFVGMEPAVRPAVRDTESGVIGVVATRSSLSGEHFKKTSAELAGQAEILTAVGEGWVEVVEKNGEDTQEAFEVVRRVVMPLVEKGADHIVLGCTHYPFLARTIEKVIDNPDVRLVNSASAIVRRVKDLLARYDIAAPAGNTPRYEFMTSAGDDYLERLAAKSKAAWSMEI